jgi:hypothetical protein
MSNFFGIGPAIRNRLINTPAVNNRVFGRIYPQVLPQNAVLPSLVYNLVSEAPSDNVSGSAGLFSGTLQIDCWDKTVIEVERLAEVVRLSLMGYSGTHLNVIIKGIYLSQGFDGYQPEVKDYLYTMRFNIWYRRVAP